MPLRPSEGSLGMTSLELQIDHTARRNDGQLFTGLAAALARWKHRRAQRLALQDLVAFSPHLLNDLGITPGDIAAALEGRAFEARRR